MTVCRGSEGFTGCRTKSRIALYFSTLRRIVPVLNKNHFRKICAAPVLMGGVAFAQETTKSLVAATEAEEEKTFLQRHYDNYVTNHLGDDSFWKKVSVNGYTNMSYTYNFNEPDDRENSYRGYDRIHNALLFNVLQLSATAESTTESRVGFGVKVNFGRNAEVFTPYDEATSDRFDIVEAWVSYQLRESLQLKLGKMGTLAGFEGADEKDNYNISRGLLWGYLQPLTHTGARLVYKPEGEKYDLTFGVNRGWDTFRHDNNDALSYEARLGYTQSDKLSYGLTYLVGPEGYKNDNDLRHLIDLVVNCQLSDKTTLGLNYDLRFDEDSAPGGGTAASHGLAGYIKHDINEKTSIAARIEGLQDKGRAVTGERQTLGSATVTVQRELGKNLFGRVELRHDASSKDVFTRETGMSKSQNSVAVSLPYTF